MALGETLKSVAARTPAIRRAWADIQRLTGQQPGDTRGGTSGAVLRVSCPCCDWTGRAMPPPELQGRRVSWRCPTCGSLSRDRAMWLTLRELTPALPAGARVLDVEPRPYTQRWFGRFNQFDYRTLGLGPGMDYQQPVHDVKLPKGVCHLVICSTGIGPESVMAETAATLNRITGDDGKVLVQVPEEAADEDLALAIRRLREAGFAVTDDAIAGRIAPESAERSGLCGAGRILICSPVGRVASPERKMIGHHH